MQQTETNSRQWPPPKCLHWGHPLFLFYDGDIFELKRWVLVLISANVFLKLTKGCVCVCTRVCACLCVCVYGGQRSNRNPFQAYAFGPWVWEVSFCESLGHIVVQVEKCPTLARSNHISFLLKKFIYRLQRLRINNGGSLCLIVLFPWM